MLALSKYQRECCLTSLCYCQQLKGDVKALSSHVVNNCSLPDFDIAQKKNLHHHREVELVFKLSFIIINWEHIEVVFK